MDNKQIIIILLVVIVALAAAIGFVLFNQATAKEQTIVKITSDSKQTEGGSPLRGFPVLPIDQQPQVHWIASCHT